MTLFTIKKALNEIKNIGIKKFFKTFKFQVSFHNKKKNDRYMKKIYKDYFVYVLQEYGKRITKATDLHFSEKNIFFFWWSGEETLPESARRNLERIKHWYAKDFNILIIHKNNLKEICNINPIFIEAFQKNRISIQTFSDILRFTLLYEKGGVWIDTTLFFADKIDFLSLLKTKSFFSLGNNEMKDWVTFNGETCTWTDFCIGGRKGNVISECCLDLYLKYLESHKNILIYLLIDDFLMLCKLAKLDDDILRKQMISNGDPFYISNHYQETLSLNNIDKIYSLPQKLDRREKYENQNPDSIYNLVVVSKFNKAQAENRILELNSFNKKL